LAGKTYRPILTNPKSDARNSKQIQKKPTGNVQNLLRTLEKMSLLPVGFGRGGPALSLG
jgi:hypothetical protein